jgi:hypothetical protein
MNEKEAKSIREAMDLIRQWEKKLFYPSLDLKDIQVSGRLEDYIKGALGEVACQSR